MTPEDQLSTAERKVLDAFRKGKSGNTKEARKLEEVGEIPVVDLENQEISGDFLRGLFCGGSYGETNHRGIIIYRAKVSSVLNMSFYEIKIPVRFHSCRFGKKIQLEGFECPELSFMKCKFQQGLNANQSKIEKGAFLALCESIGEVSLFRARIGGQLSCTGASFMNENGCALFAHNMQVDGSVLLNEGFKSTGEISLFGARIEGQLSCTDASFVNENGCALFAHNIKVDGCVLLNEGFESKGEVRLEGAEIGMWLSCSNGNFMNNKDCALFAQGIQVFGSVFLDQNFRAEGSVHLSGAEIRGQLSSKGGSFTNRKRKVLLAQGIKVGDSVILGEGFRTEGEVRLDNAEIGGTLDCTGGTFIDKEGNALIAQNAKIDGSVHMGEGFRAEGKVSLGNVRIGGQLNCKNGSFINEEGDALFAQSMKVASVVFLNSGFEAKGLVHLAGAEIKGGLDCTDGSFINEKGYALSAQSMKVASTVSLSNGFVAKGVVNLSGTEIKGELDCTGGNFIDEESALIAENIKVANMVIGENFVATGEVNLYRAKIDGGLLLEKCCFTGLRLTDVQVGTFSDDEVSYTDSDDSHYDINGFSYGRLEGGWEKARLVESRLAWLDSMNKGGEFRPQPYEQLMKVYREMGHMNWARKVGFALEEKRRKHMKSIQEPWWKIWQWILKLTIGYGYKPLRFFWSVLLLISIGGMFFSGALPCWKWENSVLSTGTKDWTGCEAWRAYPSDTRILFSDDWKINKKPPEDYPSFIPFLYATEVAFPVLPLGQTDKWHLVSLRGKFLQGSITLIGTMALAILVFYGVGTLGPRWKE